MKKLLIYLPLLAGILFSCEPIEDRASMGGAISADQLEARVEPVVVDGKNSNKVVVDCSSPVNVRWSYDLGTSQRTTDTLLMVVEGESTVTLIARNPDGTEVTKDYTVNVEELSFSVAPQWGYLCGSGEKEWVWDTQDNAGAVFGNGGYLANTAPGWWMMGSDGVDDEAPGEGSGASMVFSTKGASLTKHLSDGTTQEGTFSFDMSKQKMADDGTVWSSGKLHTNGVTVLCGISINEGYKEVHAYDILRLDDDKLYLGYAAEGTGAWGEAWFWMFQAAN